MSMVLCAHYSASPLLCYADIAMQLPNRTPGKYISETPDYHITRARFEELQEELEILATKKRPVAAKEVGRLAELGDFSENVEYQLAKRRLRGINSRILKIEHLLNRAEVIEPTSQDQIEIGHTVTVMVDEKEKQYTILGSAEVDPTKGIISHTSPIGNSLLGAHVGDDVTVHLPGGDKVFRVVGIF